MSPGYQHPRYCRHSSCDLSGDECTCSICSRCRCRTGVKAKPSYPQQCCPKNYKRNIMRLHWNLSIAKPASKHKCNNQSGPTRCNMNYCPTCKVKRTKTTCPAKSTVARCHAVIVWPCNLPSPVCSEVIDEGCP